MASKKNDEEDTIGLAICGGILVAAAGGAATMRGFQQQTIVVDGEERPAMEAFDFVSGLSGGCIPTVLYTFAQNVTTDELLDANFRLTDPSEITPEVLARDVKGEKSIFDAVVHRISLRAIPAIFYGVIMGKLHKLMTISNWRIFLKPFGIKRRMNMTNDPNASQDNGFVGPRKGIKCTPLLNFIAMGLADDKARDVIDDFYQVIDKLNERHSNEFVNNDEIVALVNEVDDPDLFIPYVASHEDVRNAMPDRGSYFENEINMNIVPLRKWSGNDHIKSIEFFLGASTNAPAMYGIQRDVSKTSKLLSKFSQRRTVYVGDELEEKTMLFVDGGFADGLGVPALVQRGVRKIVASIWPHSEARNYAVHYEAAKGKPIDVWLAEAPCLGFGDVASYFGYYSRKIECLFKNHMFDDGPARLAQLREDVDALYEAGKPIVVTMKDLKTVHNPFWGIEAGRLVDLTIIYWTLPKDFAEKLPIETVPPPNGMPKLDPNTGLLNNTEFQNFPNFAGAINYKASNKIATYLGAGSLSRRQANMSAYLGSWVINEAWEGLSVDGKQIFGGFKEILQKKKPGYVVEEC